MNTTTCMLAGQMVPGDSVQWQHDVIDIYEVVIDARNNPGQIVLTGTIVRTAEHIRLRFPTDEWVTVTRREDR